MAKCFHRELFDANVVVSPDISFETVRSGFFLIESSNISLLVVVAVIAGQISISTKFCGLHL